MASSHRQQGARPFFELCKIIKFGRYYWYKNHGTMQKKQAKFEIMSVPFYHDLLTVNNCSWWIEDRNNNLMAANMNQCWPKCYWVGVWCQPTSHSCIYVPAVYAVALRCCAFHNDFLFFKPGLEAHPFTLQSCSDPPFWYWFRWPMLRPKGGSIFWCFFKPHFPEISKPQI